ncbi:MAG: undecaprenyl-diphosphate phosphatase [Deltaproteobacteria bacterium]|nr:undecaprenyl-diphosphate phosphatase [Deltaproteobacteria bacterium]
MDIGEKSLSHLQAIFLGILQGLTEFLPVSSSGHLVLAQYFLELREVEIIFDLVLHLGTLIATIGFFGSSFRNMAREGYVAFGDKKNGLSWADILRQRPDAKLLWLVIIGSIPTALIGLLFRHQLEATFANVKMVGWHLLATAILLLATLIVRRRQGRNIDNMRLLDALIIGIAQGVAIIPGISRSGMTIAVGLLLGLDRELAARYSFVLSVPAIAGAFALQAIKHSIPIASLSTLFLGFIAALLCGLAALAFLMPVVRRGRIYLFSFYLLPLAFGALWLVK